MSFKGRKHSEETKEKMSLAQIGKKNNEKHHDWAGDKVQYKQMHKWLRKNYPPPDKCQRCNKITDKLDLSCNGNYTRNIEDYEYICRSCHTKKDNTGEWLQKKYKGEKHGMSKLIEKEVLEIRELYEPYKYSSRKLAEKYNVHQSTIDAIIHNKTWKHLIN